MLRGGLRFRWPNEGPDNLHTSERVIKVILATKNALIIIADPSGVDATCTISRNDDRVYERLSCGEFGVTYRCPAGSTIGGTRSLRLGVRSQHLIANVSMKCRDDNGCQKYSLSDEVAMECDWFLP